MLITPLSCVRLAIGEEVMILKHHANQTQKLHNAGPQLVVPVLNAVMPERSNAWGSLYDARPDAIMKMMAHPRRGITLPRCKSHCPCTRHLDKAVRAAQHANRRC